MKKGDWVCRVDGNHIGRVRAAYESLGEHLIDVVLFDTRGQMIGRESPPEGGPRNFEPACTAENWFRIERPDFKSAEFECPYGGFLHRVTPTPEGADGR